MDAKDIIQAVREAVAIQLTGAVTVSQFCEKYRIGRTHFYQLLKDGNGPRLKEVQAMADGDTVRVLLATLPRLPGGAPTLIIGGWPRMLRDGEDVATISATLEGTISRNAELRNPRSAVGLSRDGATLYLVTVDGRSQTSVGVTLVELAAIMRRLGAWQAMNFDGGGSTAMVIGGKVVNVTSDPGGEREVGNALAIVRIP